MKIIVSIMILWVRLGYSQCDNDVDRICSYNYMDVFNSTTKQYEKYKLAAQTDLQVIVSSDLKTIKFKDFINKYDKTFTIKDCLMNDSCLIYFCIDQDNNKPCELSFGVSVSAYQLVVKYEISPIIYRVSKNK